MIQTYFRPKSLKTLLNFRPAIAANNKSTTEIWIGARKNSGSYSFYQNNNLTNGVPIVQYPIGNDPTYWNVAGTGDCVHLQYQAIDGSVHFYDNVSCTALKSSFCQYSTQHSFIFCSILWNLATLFSVEIFSTRMWSIAYSWSRCHQWYNHSKFGCTMYTVLCSYSMVCRSQLQFGYNGMSIVHSKSYRYTTWTESLLEFLRTKHLRRARNCLLEL